MTYFKLDYRILDSSLWLNESVYTRLTFLTMNMMADANHDDPAVCPATAPGIARRANLPEEEVRASLAVLEAPDPDDTSGVDEGRRVRRVPGGYFITNRERYASKVHTSTERVRRHRANKRGVGGKKQ